MSSSEFSVIALSSPGRAEDEEILIIAFLELGISTIMRDGTHLSPA